MNMNTTILNKKYKLSECDKNEILRYAGVKENSRKIDSLLDECLKELPQNKDYSVCYGEFPLSVCGDLIDFSTFKVHSKDLAKNLFGCLKSVIFSSTIGLEYDRLIMRYSVKSPSKALLFQAIGAERIECLCNMFNNDIKKFYSDMGFSLTPRFSPGYGDLPLEIQKDIFNILDCPRKIGLYLNDSLLMSPTKSVTAIIGVKPIL